MKNKANTKNMNQGAKRELKPRLRFLGFTGPWEEKVLTPYLKEHTERVSANTALPIYSSTRAGLKPQKDYYDGRELVNDGEYGVVPDGFFVYRHMSDDGAFKFNINKSGRKIAVSKEYPVFTTVDLHPDFLLHKINDGDDFKQFALMQKKGGTRTRLYFSTLCSWKTLLPTYREQQKIADCLSSIVELITLEAQKLATLKTHKKGLMQQLFPAEGETLPKLRFPEFRDAGEWDRKQLGDVATFYNGRAYKQEELLDQGKYRVLRVGNFFTNNNWYYSDLELDETKYCDNGDLLYAWSASFGPRIWEGEKVIYHYHIWKVVEKPGINENFLFTILNSETERLKSQSASGLGLMHVTKGAIESWECRLPEPDEQLKIADFLTSIDEMITAQTQKLTTLKAHKKGLMQQLFPALDEVQG